MNWPFDLQAVQEGIAYASLLLLTAANPSGVDGFICYEEWSISGQVAWADTVVIARKVSGLPGAGLENTSNEAVPGITQYEVVEILKDDTQTVEVGDAVERKWVRHDAIGSMHLLYGVRIDEMTWYYVSALSDEARDYVLNLPSIDASVEDRLLYAINYLEHAHPLINSDAWITLTSFSTEDLVASADQLDRETLRALVTDEDTTPKRVGYYAMMLGLCGNSEDAEYMRQWILEPPPPGIRNAADGMMTGYLWLTGERGLELLEQEKLSDPDEIFSELYGAMQAVRFMMRYGNDRIPRERLAASLQPLLDNPLVADLVITDLARWEDWSVIDRIFEMYDTTQEGAIKRSIIRYLLYAQHAGMTDDGDAAADMADMATRYLEALTERDPATVEQATRYFSLPEEAEASTIY